MIQQLDDIMVRNLAMLLTFPSCLSLLGPEVTAQVPYIMSGFKAGRKGKGQRMYKVWYAGICRAGEKVDSIILSYRVHYPQGETTHPRNHTQCQYKEKCVDNCVRDNRKGVMAA